MVPSMTTLRRGSAGHRKNGPLVTHMCGYAWVPLPNRLRNMCIGRARNSYGNFPISRTGTGPGSWSRRRYRIPSLILRVVIRLERFRNAWWSVDDTHRSLAYYYGKGNPPITGWVCCYATM